MLQRLRGRTGFGLNILESLACSLQRLLEILRYFKCRLETLLHCSVLGLQRCARFVGLYHACFRILGALIGLSPRDLYGDICAGYLGLSALQEQQVAGAMMAGAGAAIYLVAALRRLGLALKLTEATT